MNIVERAKNIILSPKTEWSVVEGESASVKSIYMEYLLILAAVPAIASFIGTTLIGYSMFGVSVRVPLLAGIGNLIVGYVLSLGMIYVIALIADALAPNFGGQKNPLNAFKLIAFSMTPGLLGGIFGILPTLAVLGLLASLYGIYLLYVGVPTLMKVPQDKAVPYTLVLVICAIVAGVITSAVIAAVSGLGMHSPALSISSNNPAAPAAISVNTPAGKVEIDTAELDAMSQKLESINKQAEAAAQQGDAKASMEAAGKALQALGEAMAAQSATAGK